MRTCLLKRDKTQEVSMGEQCNPRHKYSEYTLLKEKIIYSGLSPTKGVIDFDSPGGNSMPFSMIKHEKKNTY